MNVSPHRMALMCVNQKVRGKCCAMYDAAALYEYFRTQLKLKRPDMDKGVNIRAVKTSCLGKCAFGPNILISPDNIWYKYESKADIDEIIEVHFLQNKIVTRLLNPGLHHEYA